MFLLGSDLAYLHLLILLMWCGISFGGLVFLAGRLGVRYHWGCLIFGFGLVGWPGFDTFFRMAC
jgi:hypothetical protein